MLADEVRAEGEQQPGAGVQGTIRQIDLLVHVPAKVHRIVLYSVGVRTEEQQRKP